MSNLDKDYRYSDHIEGTLGKEIVSYGNHGFPSDSHLTLGMFENEPYLMASLHTMTIV